MDRLEETSNAVGCDLAEEILRKFGRVRVRVSGTSMAPAVRPGDLLSIERADVDEIAPGEIALFARQGRLFAHRVVSRGGCAREAYLLTRGDRLRQDDPPVSSFELLGRVTSIHRGQRQIIPHESISRMERMIGRVLRASERATFIYLRWAALQTKKISERSTCPA